MVVKNNIIAALDLGTHSIKLAVASYSDAGKNHTPQIVAEAQVPSRGLRKGIVVNLDMASEAISDALAEVETKNKIKVSEVLLALSGSHIECVNTSGEIQLRSSEVGPHDLRRVVERANQIVIPRDREVLHVLPQEFVIDGQDGIKQPLGMSGRKLECRAHIITGSESTARNFVKCANRAGLTVRDVVASSVALSRSVLSNDEQELGVALIDFGAGTCDVSVMYRGANLLSLVFPFGGNHISNDLATGLKTTLAVAEEIKCQKGHAWPSDISAHDVLDCCLASGKSQKVSRLLVAEIIEARLVELFGIISAQFESLGLKSLLGAGLVITGGSARLAGIDKLAERVFGLPVKVTNSRQTSSADFAVAEGLLSFTFENEGVQAYFKPERGIKKVFSKLNGWFAENI
jgi:cell division protein FtsA